MAEAEEIMARVSPSRVIFVLGWSAVAKDGILRKLTGSPAGARATFDTDSIAHRVYAPPEPSDSSFVYVSLSSFAGITLDDSPSADALSVTSSPSITSPGVLDLARLGSVGGIMLLCGPSITPHDRTLLRFVQAFFGPASLSKVTVIFNLWDQCRDDAYTTLRARLQGSATDIDIAAIRNPPGQFLGGKILTCAPRAAGDERVTNLSPIVRKRYDGLGGQFSKLQFVREIEDGREPAKTEAARVLERGEDGSGGLLRVVDGYARVVGKQQQRRVSRSNTTASTSSTTGRRRSSLSAQKMAQANKGQKSGSDEESRSPDEFEPPMSPAPTESMSQPLFPSMVPMPVQVEIDQAAEEDVKVENSDKDSTPIVVTTTKDGEHSAQSDTASQPTLVDGPSSPTAAASSHPQPTEETPLLSRPSTSSSVADSLPSSTISSTAPSTSSSQCLAQRRRIRLLPSFKAVRKLLKRPLALLSDALAATKAKTAEVTMRTRRALWMAFVVVPLALVRAAFWMTATVVVRLLMPQREDGPAETVISSL